MLHLLLRIQRKALINSLCFQWEFSSKQSNMSSIAIGTICYNSNCRWRSDHDESFFLGLLAGLYFPLVSGLVSALWLLISGQTSRFSRIMVGGIMM